MIFGYIVSFFGSGHGATTSTTATTTILESILVADLNSALIMRNASLKDASGMRQGANSVAAKLPDVRSPSFASAQTGCQVS